MPDRGEESTPSLLARHRPKGGTHEAYRRVVGVHRAEGLAGPTRRYLVIVTLLVSTSSMPILAAMGTGSASVTEVLQPAGMVPFIAPPTGTPMVVVPGEPVGTPTTARPVPQRPGDPASRTPRTPRTRTTPGSTAPDPASTRPARPTSPDSSARPTSPAKPTSPTKPTSPAGSQPKENRPDPVNPAPITIVPTRSPMAPSPITIVPIDVPGLLPITDPDQRPGDGARPTPSCRPNPTVTPAPADPSPVPSSTGLIPTPTPAAGPTPTPTVWPSPTRSTRPAPTATPTRPGAPAEDDTPPTRHGGLLGWLGIG